VLRSISGKLRWRVQRAFMRVFGRPVTCRRCGAELGRVVMVRQRGRLRVLGASDLHLRVRFSARDEVAFEHATNCVRDVA
jgi:hypothetical protein